MNLKNILLPLACLCFSATAFAQQEKDTIYLKKDNKPKEAPILEESFKGVTYAVGAGKAVYFWKEIDRIEYGSRPKELGQAFGMIRKGEAADAIKILEKFKAMQGLRPIYRQQLLFNYAQAAEANSKLDEAINTYRDLLKEFKQSRYLAKANERIVACLIATKKPDEAHKAIDAARKDAIENKLDEQFLRDLDLVEASLLESEDKLAEAANAYDKLAAASSSNPEIADLAKISSARCQMKKGGNPSQARLVYEAVTNKTGDDFSPVVMAAAWNGTGEILLSEARKSDKKPEKVREALYCFLRGIVQFFPGENDRTSEHERSLYFTAETFEELSKTAADEAEKKSYKQRAEEKRQELRSRYPLSPFAGK